MSLHKDLIFLILQFCDEQNLKKTARMLEQETGYFFRLAYFEELVLNGNWEEVENYVSSFTKIGDNIYSARMYLEMRKQKFIEALDRHDYTGGMHVLHNELKDFGESNKTMYEEMGELLALNNFREHTAFTSHGDTLTARKKMMHELRILIHANPILQGRTVLPQIDKSRLKFLINQSLSWQHHHCAYPRPPQPRIDTLFTDHKCSTGSSSSPNILTISIPRFIKPLDEEQNWLATVKPQGLVQPKNLEKQSVNKIVEVSILRTVLLFTEVKNNVIRRLLYTNAGNGILALTEDGTLLLWRWLKSNTNLVIEATKKWESSIKPLLIDVCSGNMDAVTRSFCLTRNDFYLISASGRMITLYCMRKFEKIRNIMLPPPAAATCIIFYHPDNNIIVVGMDDSTIFIYNMLEERVISKLQGHSTRISGLAFSTTLHVLISSAVDNQIVLWDCVNWEKKKSVVIHMAMQSSSACFGWLAPNLSIELDKDEKHLLAVQETQLAICETITLQCLKQWDVANFSTWISHATFSCDAQLVYAVMTNGTLIILDASNLIPTSKINPFAYLPYHPSSNDAYAVVVAAHRQNPNQVALGLSNGGVIVVEPVPAGI